MKIQNYAKPSTMEEAYELLQADGTIIGGGAWLKLLPKTIVQGVDLSGLGLDVIHSTQEEVHIGSMVTLRELEVSEDLQGLMNGLLTDAVGHVMGIPFRNIATIGGTVAGRFGFSDILTPLLAMGAKLRFKEHGLITLETYLVEPFKGKDILIEVILPKVEGRGQYFTLKKTSNDFPILNAAILKVRDEGRIVIGSRPGSARLAVQANGYLQGKTSLSEAEIVEVQQLVLKDIQLGSNSRGSAEYREEVCKTFVKRGLMEVYR